MLRRALQATAAQLDFFGSLLKPADPPPADPPPIEPPAPTQDPTEPTPPAIAAAGFPASDFYRDDDRALPPNWRLRAAANLHAISLSARIVAEARAPTPEEQSDLAQFVGYGSTELANGCFLSPGAAEFRPGWEEPGHALRAATTPAEYAALAQGTQYQHFTPQGIARAIWAGLLRLGFAGGNVLEPGIGVGAFASLTPPDLRGRVRFVGIEADPIAARICGLLHPSAEIRAEDFTRTPIRGGFAAAIGNPPFSTRVVRTDPAYRALGLRLHDFFIVKAIDALAPGGVAAFVTSYGTLDKAETGARAEIARRADLIAAYRLPRGAFSATAGTDVGVDILFLRRREADLVQAFDVADWIETRPAGIADAPDLRINGYFLDNPRHVLGAHAAMRGPYGPRSVYACEAHPSHDLDAALAHAITRLPEGLLTRLAPAAAPILPEGAPAPIAISSAGNDRLREGSYFIAEDGRLCQVLDGIGVAVPLRTKETPTGVGKPQADLIRALIPIRDAVREILRLQQDRTDAADAQGRLSALYDGFTRRNGPINKTVVQERPAREAGQPPTEIHRQVNLSPFVDDPDCYLVASIENYDLDSDTATRGLIFSGIVVGARTEPEVRTPADALARCLHEQGRVDIVRVAELARLSQGETIAALGAGLYRDPESEEWETADAYLSGRVRGKLRVANAAMERDPGYRRNVEALEAVLPVDLPPSDITARLGAPWIPAGDVEAFVREIVGVPHATILHTPEIAFWSIDRQQFSYRPAVDAKWGTARYSAFDVINDALNARTPQIFDEFTNPDGGTSRVLNAVETEAAKDRISALKTAFEGWVWGDPDRSVRLARIYNDRYNDIVPRAFDGSHLMLPGASDAFTFRPHQKRAVWRIIVDGGTYLAHAVGAGKSAVLAAACMEQRRLGLVAKPIMPVPGHCLAQVAREFLSVYPLARILVADEQNFARENRRRFLARAATGDWDCILITHAAFKLIPVSASFEAGMIRSMIDDYTDLISRVDKYDRLTVKKLQRMREIQKQKLESLRARKDDFLDLGEIGVDQILTDEAQAYRKLAFTTNQTGLKGVDPVGSQTAWDLYVKAAYIRAMRRLREDGSDGADRALVMASGTPITNTLGELFTLQRFMGEEALRSRDLHEFDAWSAAFGEARTDLELQPSGAYRPVTRFAEFVNVPELVGLFREFADVVTAEELGTLVERPAIKGGKRRLITAPPSEAFRDYQRGLADRVKAIEERGGKPKKGDDILLSVVTDGRHAAIDLRLVDRDASNDPDNKLNLLIREALRIYRESAERVYLKPDGTPFERRGGAQMIFSDLGTLSVEASRGFSAYRWIRSELIRNGVPEGEIAIAQEFNTSKKKARLFADFRAGVVRFALGSTQVMGTGVNGQTRLIAKHDLDVPYLPSDIEQRDGRALRQGNQNGEIELLAYATEGSTDATQWQTLERKARFIAAIMAGDRSIRRIEDVGDTVNQFALAKALASGDPRLLQKAGLEAEIARLERRRSAHYDHQHAMQGRVRWAEREIAEMSRRAIALRAAAERRGPTERGFAIEIRGRSHYVLKEGGRALTDAITAVDLEARAGSNAQRTGRAERTVGAYAGLDLHYACEASADHLDGCLRLVGDGFKIATNTRGNTPGAVAAGQVVEAADSLEELAGDAEGRIARAREAIEAAAPLIGLPFDLQGELEQKRADLTRLNDSLRAKEDGETKSAA